MFNSKIALVVVPGVGQENAAYIPKQRTDLWHSPMIQVNGLRLGSKAGSGLDRSAAAQARYVGAGAEIIVSGDTVSANMHLMNTALNYRIFGSTQITSAANPFRLGLWRGRRSRLQSACFQIDSAGGGQGSNGKDAQAAAEHCHIGMFAKCSRQEAEANQH
jgi:hypothetical protein